MSDYCKPDSLAWRPAVADDDAFLYKLYCTTRLAEMAGWGWNEAQQETFLRMQFTAQRHHYEIAYPGAAHTILLFDDQPAGRLLVFRSKLENVLVDIALLPEKRGIGIGTALILELLEEANKAGKPVRLHVERHNRARGLYERLGFEIIEDTGIYFKMEWRPAARETEIVKDA